MFFYLVPSERKHAQYNLRPLFYCNEVILLDNLLRALQSSSIDNVALSDPYHVRFTQFWKVTEDPILWKPLFSFCDKETEYTPIEVCNLITAII